MNPSFDAQPARDPRLQQVLDRAATDPAFRGRLLAGPHAAIRDAFGVQIPESFRLKFVERTPDVDALIVLPNAVAPSAAGADGELDEASLETVAGGWSPWGDGTGSAAQAEGGDWNAGTWW